MMQHPENIYLVLCILGVILIGSNLVMYGIVRGSKGMSFDWFKDLGRTARQPWSKEDQSLDELAKQAEKIRSEQKPEDKP
jgi:hypothetical protein